MGKIIKELPESYLVSSPEDNDTKTFFYVGTSKSISEAKSCIYDIGYAIPTLICDSEKVEILKIGVTNNIETRLKYYRKEIPDFEIIKSWNIKNAKTLESRLKDQHYKDGFSSYGSEWFWDVNSKKENLIEEIEWLIDNSYKREKNGYSHLHK